jgi:hypothetical protein
MCETTVAVYYSRKQDIIKKNPTPSIQIIIANDNILIFLGGSLGLRQGSRHIGHALFSRNAL